MLGTHHADPVCTDLEGYQHDRTMLTLSCPTDKESTPISQTLSILTRSGAPGNTSLRTIKAQRRDG